MDADREVVQEILSPHEAAAYTRFSEKFLANLRSTGGGPIYSKLSPKAVRYRKADIDAWLAERLRRSTFDDRPVEAAATR